MFRKKLIELDRHYAVHMIPCWSSELVDEQRFIHHWVQKWLHM
jgi:hypothetical protein